MRYLFGRQRRSKGIVEVEKTWHRAGSALRVGDLSAMVYDVEQPWTDRSGMWCDSPHRSVRFFEVRNYGSQEACSQVAIRHGVAEFRRRISSKKPLSVALRGLLCRRIHWFATLTATRRNMPRFWAESR